MTTVSPASSSIVDATGNTPAVWLDRLTDGLQGRVLLKLESMNPGGSIKDRPALQCLRDAEQDGRLRPGMAVVELTSGNMGIGLATACAVMGYRMIAVMSEGNSRERRQLLAAYGAEIELVPQGPESIPGQVSGEDLALVEQRTETLVAELNAWRPDQFNNPSNPRAHELGTGPELWEQSNENLDAFVAIVGTGGTFVGIARALKRRDSTIRCLAVEPAGAQTLARLAVTNSSHRLQGAGYALIPPQWDDSLCDGTIAIEDDEAMGVARALARREGILAGFSTGANVAAALRMVAAAEPGFTVATVACDTGTRYLSTDLFVDDAMEPRKVR
ncbi:MAG TPA: cysteine synthase family protein [Thermomicrobiales bacterium]|nr:cysteine synthase family protein [Thermomicrobiales bacterium]